MLIDRAGWPFVAVAAVPAVVVWPWSGAWAAACLALPALVALFFRDPERHPPDGPALVLAPADGRVMFAGPARADEAPAGQWAQVTIFLSVLDVHINRTPVAGRVTRVDYRAGSFLPAYRREAAHNEQSEIWFDHEGQTVVARQVVGVLARRVVCRLTVGQVVAAGARLGLMKFGSRMDVFVPPGAVLDVHAGDRVRGGETVIAQLEPGA